MAYIGTVQDGTGTTVYPQIKMDGIIDKPTALQNPSKIVTTDTIEKGKLDILEIANNNRQTEKAEYTIRAGGIVTLNLNFTPSVGTPAWQAVFKILDGAKLFPITGNALLILQDTGGTGQRCLTFGVSGNDLVLSILGSGIAQNQYLGSASYNI
ncbi:MAG: hypothetical protein LKJ22_01055 [Liquorilactobacillus nagelii]|jgi:hypothetical protein|uniref:Uncharacterized protein n=1 Tax=Liquorilactobacillus hordei TaxID=468911 RepID=A0A3S6QP15_9LACO|nr:MULTISPECIES: hypothetical protein [Liquorilactobacillus]AUJ29638.1 hypothetical protein BSQ49_05140 [Liquorilactobacillus hordei]MCI1920492.1 hypothetical protein [Liquorilactobacillus nagelii]MCI1976135.1 hypothetical protein [Liquorilactobacillus nagelii]